MRNLLRVSLHDALDYEESNDLACEKMDFRGYESKLDWFSNQMDVNFCVILTYKKINDKATRYSFSLLCQYFIFHLENVCFFVFKFIYNINFLQCCIIKFIHNTCTN